MALTKIVATIGPAAEKPNIIPALIKNGASVFRFNLKHSSYDWHSRYIRETQRAAEKIGKPIAILLDIPGAARKISGRKLLRENLKDLSLAAKHEVDFLALSFVKNKKDINSLRKQAEKLSLRSKILAKIETSEALDNFEEILEYSDGIMIARGDLGEKIPYEQVPYYQKKIIRWCIEKGKPVITATQMLKSMVSQSLPTRAEISDVANAILDYTGAVMLSEETAIGKYPAKSVAVMERICRFWEEKRPAISGFNFDLNHQTSAICYSAYQLWMSPFCQKKNIRAFALLTRTGMTANMISRLRPNLPILALTNDKKLRDQLSLVYGVFPLFFKEKKLYKKRNTSDIRNILARIKESGYVKKGQKVIFIYGEEWGTAAKTSIVRIQEIP